MNEIDNAPTGAEPDHRERLPERYHKSREMTEEKRKEYAEKFREVMHLQSDAMDSALSGRQKYDSITRRPKPFEGISVIHNISREQSRELGLGEQAQSVISSVADNGLEHNIAFVASECFHATTFDLINFGDHAGLLGDSYPQVRADVEAAAIEFMQAYPPISETVTVSGLGLFCPQVLKLDLSIRNESMTTFQDFRLKLHAHLTETVDGYSKIRKPDWNRKLSAHVTFGYFVNPLDEQEIGRFLNLLEAFNRDFRPIPFELTQGEVTRFTDMDSYLPV